MQGDNESMQRVLLQVVSKYADAPNSNMQPRVVLTEVSKILNIHGDIEKEQTLLTLWYDLLRNGQIAWGYDIHNSAPPFCHVTAHGRKTLENMSRDPANPDGYTQFLSQRCALNVVAHSYVSEALRAYNADCPKSAAVMIGAAAESIALELRDELLTRIEALHQTPPSDLSDWRVKRVFDTLTGLIDKRKSSMPTSLRESYESFWRGFAGQLRMTRNDAGHPSSVDPVTSETAHSSLLIFPEYAKLVYEIKHWISTDYR